MSTTTHALVEAYTTAVNEGHFGRIGSSTLIFDWRRWPEVIDELRRRTTTPAR